MKAKDGAKNHADHRGDSCCRIRAKKHDTKNHGARRCCKIKEQDESQAEELLEVLNCSGCGPTGCTLCVDQIADKSAQSTEAARYKVIYECRYILFVRGR